MRALTIRTQKPSSFTSYRLGALFLGALMLATACNRPAEEPPANLFATSVSSTLTAQPVAQPTSTQAPDTPTPEIDESTPEPTEILGETESAPTEEPTLEPAVSSTPSPTPIPLETGDPRSGLNLSNPDYADDFHDVRWHIGSDEDATFALEDGSMRIINHKTDGFLWWTTTAVLAEDSYAEIMAQISSCSGKDAYGMAIRVGGDKIDQGYTLEISCDGAWRVRKFIGGDDIPAGLRDWTDSDVIQTGSDATNQIGFLASGDQLFAFVNGELLDTVPIEDSDYTSGVPSLFANASQTPDLTVHFDDFRLWHLLP